MKKRTKIASVVLMFVLLFALVQIFASAATAASTVVEYINYDIQQSKIGISPVGIGTETTPGDRYGKYSLGSSENGNKYVKYTPTVARGSNTAAAYFYFTLGDMSGKWDGTLESTKTKIPVRQQEYYLVDFDFASESGNYADIAFSPSSRLMTDSGRNFPSGGSAPSFGITTDIEGRSYVYAGNEKFYIEGGNLNWNHITLLIDVDQVTVSKTKMHIYVDGEYFYTFDSVIPSGADDPASYAGGDMEEICLYDFRLNVPYSTDEDSDVCFDNFRARIFPKGYTGDATTGLAKFSEEPTNSIANCSDSIYNANYQYPFGIYRADVNDVKYDDINEAISAALALDNAKLTLRSNVLLNSSIRVTKNLEFDLNGHTLATESADSKLASFVLSKDASLKVLSSAPGGKIFNISYQNGKAWGAAIFATSSKNTNITIDGKNLSTYSASLVDFSSGSDSTSSLTVMGGSYYSPVRDSLGFIMNRVSSATIKISDALIALPSTAALYSTDAARGAGGISNAVFERCTILSATNETTLIYQLEKNCTVAFNDCKIFGAFLPYAPYSSFYTDEQKANSTLGKILIDDKTRFVGIPTYSENNLEIPEDYKFTGVSAIELDITLSYNKFMHKDGASIDATFVLRDYPMHYCFQTGIVPADTKTATVNWYSADGKTVLLTEEYAVGSIPGFTGTFPIVESGNGWYDYSLDCWDDVIVEKADATYNIYPTLAIELNISAYQSIILHNAFTAELYLPADAANITVISVKDEKGNLLSPGKKALIDGMAYTPYSFEIGATSLSKDAVFVIEFNITDEKIGLTNQNISMKYRMNVSDYAEQILSGKYTAEEKALAADMIRYALECYKVVNDSKSYYRFEELIVTYDDYVTEYPEYFGNTEVYSRLKTYIASVHFALGSAPAFVFTTADGFTEGMSIVISWNSVNGKKNTKVFEYDASKTEFTLSDMKVFDVVSILNIKVIDQNGEELGSGYYSLATYINSMSYFKNGFARALYIFASSAQRYRYPFGSSDIVTYKDFGAVGDGVTDDFLAIKNAHAYANANGLKVVAGAGKYLIGDQGSASIVIKTDTDWNGATFILDDTNIAPGTPAQTTPLFLVPSDYSRVDIKSGFVPLTTESDNIGFELGYSALVCIINSTHKDYIRYGGNADNGQSQQDIVRVDAEGNIDPSTPLIFDYDTITTMYVYRIDEDSITIEGGYFETKYNHAPSEYTYYARGILVTRSGTTIKNVKHQIDDSTYALLKNDEGNQVYEGKIPKNNYSSTTYYTEFSKKTDESGAAYYQGVVYYDGNNSVDYTHTIKFLPVSGQTYYQSSDGMLLYETDLTAGGKLTVKYKRTTSGSYYYVTCTEQYHGAPMSYFISAQNTDGVTIEGCVFENPKGFDTMGSGGSVVGMGSYEITASYCNDITWKNCYMTNFRKADGSVPSQGQMGTNHCKNMLFDGNVLASFDAHTGAGNVTIKNCEIEHINTIGGGNVLIENTVIHSHNGGYLVNLRSDYGSIWKGNLTLRNVTAINGTRTHLGIVNATYVNHYFGYEACMPTNITVDGLTVVSSAKVNVLLCCGNLNQYKDVTTTGTVYNTSGNVVTGTYKDSEGKVQTSQTNLNPYTVTEKLTILGDIRAYTAVTWDTSEQHYTEYPVYTPVYSADKAYKIKFYTYGTDSFKNVVIDDSAATYY